MSDAVAFSIKRKFGFYEMLREKYSFLFLSF